MIKVLNYTHNPLTVMATCAKECWGSNPKDLVKVAKEIIESGHGRVSEFADVTVVIDGYSARTIRELYTHIIGTSRLQASTRYIKYGEFDYFTPPSIKNKMGTEEYTKIMDTIKEGYQKLQELDIPKEDVANVLPLAMISRVVLKINVRALIHLAEMRLCTRAYHEIRKLVIELLNILSELDDEWKWIVSQCKPKCDMVGFCTEKFCCGRQPKKSDLEQLQIKELSNKEDVIVKILNS
jgi:thymidylate synthase (FAD)